MNKRIQLSTSMFRLPLMVLVVGGWVPLAAQRTFATKTVVNFGGLQDDPALEMTRVSSVVRTPNGQFVVATGKPVEVRLYDGTGKLLRRLGRAGAGPGEFRSTPYVRPWTGDSILTLSTGTQRWMLYGLNGTVVREWPVDSLHPFPNGTRLQNWAYTRIETIGSRGCTTPVVSKLPVPAPWTPREAVTDAAGRVWVAGTKSQWQIYSPTGAQLGNVTLPPNFTILQFSGNLVIGTRYDDDDAEYVTAVEVSLPAAPQGPARCEIPALMTPEARRILTNMGNIRTAGEAYRSDAKKYPDVMPTNLVKVAEDLDATIVYSTFDSWVVVVKEKTGPLRCMFSFGMHGLIGWGNGSLACTK